MYTNKHEAHNSTPKLVAISTTISIAIVYILVDYAISHCSYATENVLIVTATIIAKSNALS